MKTIKQQKTVSRVAIGVFRHRSKDKNKQYNSPLVYLYYNCGWRLLNNKDKVFSHKEKDLLFISETKPTKHITNPDKESDKKSWRRINNIYYNHPTLGNIIVRITDGNNAFARCPDTDKILAVVKFDSLTETKPFSTGFIYRGNKAIEKAKPKKKPKSKSITNNLTKTQQTNLLNFLETLK